MNISMSQSARYTTQQRMWGTHVLGPLTDRAINRYIDAGYYGAEAKAKRHAARKSQKHVKLKALLADLLV